VRTGYSLMALSYHRIASGSLFADCPGSFHSPSNQCVCPATSGFRLYYYCPASPSSAPSFCSTFENCLSFPRSSTSLADCFRSAFRYLRYGGSQKWSAAYSCTGWHRRRAIVVAVLYYCYPLCLFLSHRGHRRSGLVRYHYHLCYYRYHY
jgi:hypothetical protein